MTPWMVQPAEMRTPTYVYGVEVLNGDDAWALFQASALGDLAAVERLIQLDPRLVNAQYWYQQPLHLAVYAGHAEIVEFLLGHGADPGESLFTYNSWNKLLRRAGERGFGRIEALLQQTMQSRFNYHEEFERLQEAIIGRDREQVEAVLRDRPDLADKADALGNNALHWSVITRQLDLVDRFVAWGTPVNARRADGQPPVLLAANGATDYWFRSTRGRSHPSLRNAWLLVGSLLAHGAEYSISIAAAAGDQERLDELLIQDPGLAKRLDSARVSPLTYSAREGYLHLVRRLLERGADPNLPEAGAPRGLALFEACSRNHFEVAELLLKHGADPNAGADSSGCCLTICEVRHGQQAKPLQQLLRRYGAYTPPYAMTTREIRQAVKDGQPAPPGEEFLSIVLAKRDPTLLGQYLDVVQAGGHIDFPVGARLTPAQVTQLLARGMDPHQPDWLGNTLLHVHAAVGDRAVVALLLEAGADLNAREVEFQGTPLAAAVRNCCETTDPKQAVRLRRMVEFLLRRGVVTQLPDDRPWATPLAWAIRYGRDDLAVLLRRYGAA